MPGNEQGLDRLKQLRERQLTDRCSGAAIVVLAIFGVVGRAIDTPENIKDLIR